VEGVHLLLAFKPVAYNANIVMVLQDVKSFLLLFLARSFNSYIDSVFLLYEILSSFFCGNKKQNIRNVKNPPAISLSHMIDFGFY